MPPLCSPGCSRRLSRPAAEVSAADTAPATETSEVREPDPGFFAARRWFLPPAEPKTPRRRRPAKPAADLAPTLAEALAAGAKDLPAQVGATELPPTDGSVAAAPDREAVDQQAP